TGATTVGVGGPPSRPVIPVPGAHPVEEPPLLVGERVQAALLDLFQKLVHPPLFLFALLLLTQRPLGGAALAPTLEGVELGRPRGRRRVFLQAGEAAAQFGAVAGFLDS